MPICLDLEHLLGGDPVSPEFFHRPLIEEEFLYPEQVLDFPCRPCYVLYDKCSTARHYVQQIRTRMDVAYFVLADAAQVVGGKLYMLGGGWDKIWVNSFPTQHIFAICVGIKVPWEATNAPHTMKILIETADGQGVSEIHGNFEVGKPAGLVQGSPQLINLAFPQILEAKEPGRYRARALIDDDLVDELSFSTVPRQPAP